MALDWQDSSSAAIIHPDFLLTFDSYRMNRFLDDGSLAHLALGPLAQQMQDCRDAMFDVLETNGADWFEAADGHRFFNRAGDELWIKDEYYFDPPLRLFDTDSAITFRSRISGRRVPIPVDPGSFAVLGSILSKLNRRTSVRSLGEQLEECDRAFIEDLESAGLVATTALTAAEPPKDFRVTLAGHSCLLIESPRSRILIDPLLVVRHRPRLNLTDLTEELDSIVISHPHWDHFNLDTLLLVDRRTPIVIPKLRSRPSIVNIDMAFLLREMGFEHIIAMEPWGRAQFGDIELVSLPFHGEGSGREGRQDWQTYLIELGGKKLLGLVDACADNFGSMDDVLVELRRTLGPVDVLFSPCADFQFQISQYQRRPFALSRCLEQFTGSAADTLRWAAITEAKMIVPYAEFIYEMSDLDRAPSTPAQKGTQRDLFRLASPEIAARIKLVPPRGSISWNGGTSEHPISEAAAGSVC